MQGLFFTVEWKSSKNDIYFGADIKNMVIHDHYLSLHEQFLKISEQFLKILGAKQS